MLGVRYPCDGVWLRARAACRCVRRYVFRSRGGMLWRRSRFYGLLYTGYAWRIDLWRSSPASAYDTNSGQNQYNQRYFGVPAQVLHYKSLLHDHPKSNICFCALCLYLISLKTFAETLIEHSLYAHLFVGSCPGNPSCSGIRCCLMPRLHQLSAVDGT